MMMLDWTRRAACLDQDPELFFPISMEGPSQSQVEEAKAVCRGCPVREPCLAYALSTRQAYGVWGGTDPEQRRELSPTATRRPETVPAQPLRGDR
ncbi:WhiB family transcriptional regulator [Nonomuraea sp. LP-02]|nr:WhiB family transcriptional regulator [Nonomuraea sp. LP-02]MED7923575.1 WhiB family transcriptional regulator [Nonomuraea sp. LP-02]